MTIFNITTYENAMKFLCGFLDVSEYEIFRYLEDCYDEENGSRESTEELLEELNVNLNELNVEQVSFIINHITTRKSLESLRDSLRSDGILNLQEVLTKDTELKRYLNELEVYIDVPNKSIKVQNEEITLSDSIDDIKNESLKRVCKKIYRDYQVDGFFSMASDRHYGGEVHERPEFLFDLEEYLSKIKVYIDLQGEWKKSTKSYIIKYKASLDEIYWFKAYETECEYEEDVDKVKIKKELIRKALNVITSVKFENGKIPEEIAIMKDDVNVLSRNILDIIPY